MRSQVRVLLSPPKIDTTQLDGVFFCMVFRQRKNLRCFRHARLPLMRALGRRLRERKCRSFATISITVRNFLPFSPPVSFAAPPLDKGGLWNADPSAALRALRMTCERTERKQKGPSGTVSPYSAHLISYILYLISWYLVGAKWADVVIGPYQSLL